MAFEYKDVLAGPIVRRVEQQLVSVWIALRKPATGKLSVWEGVKTGDASSGTELITGSVDTISVGAELHLALVVAILPDNPGEQLKSDTLYSYDLEVKEPGTASGQRLLQLGLLGDADSKGNKCPEPLGYKKRRLPAFSIPPSDIGKLHLLQGSCRMPHADRRCGRILAGRR